MRDAWRYLCTERGGERERGRGRGEKGGKKEEMNALLLPPFSFSLFVLLSPLCPATQVYTTPLPLPAAGLPTPCAKGTLCWRCDRAVSCPSPPLSLVSLVVLTMWESPRRTRAPRKRRSATARPAPGLDRRPPWRRKARKRARREGERRGREGVCLCACVVCAREREETTKTLWTPTAGGERSEAEAKRASTAQKATLGQRRVHATEGVQGKYDSFSL